MSFDLYEDDGVIHTTPEDAWHDGILDLNVPDEKAHIYGSNLEIPPTFPITIVFSGIAREVLSVDDPNIMVRLDVDAAGNDSSIILGHREGGTFNRNGWWVSYGGPNGNNAAKYYDIGVEAPVFLMFILESPNVQDIHLYQDRRVEIEPYYSVSEDPAEPNGNFSYLNVGGDKGVSTWVNCVVDELYILNENLLNNDRDEGVINYIRRNFNRKGFSYEHRVPLEYEELTRGFRTTIERNAYGKAKLNSTPTSGPKLATEIVNGNEIEITAFYDRNLNIKVARRFKGEDWEISTIDNTVLKDPGDYGNEFGGIDDGHRGLGVGVDGEGHAHIYGGIWVEDLNDGHHFRSNEPIDTWDLTTTSEVEYNAASTKATYPHGARTSNGTFFLVYRQNGNSASADHVAAYWDSDTGKMEPFDAVNQNGKIMVHVPGDVDDDTSLYISGFRRDENGNLHFVFVFQKDNDGPGGGKTIQDERRFSHVILDEDNNELQLPDGTVLSDPFTFTDLGGTSAVIDDSGFDPGWHWMVKMGMIDGNKPVVCHNIEDTNGYWNHFLYTYDGTSWSKDKVTNQQTVQENMNNNTRHGTPRAVPMPDGTVIILSPTPDKSDRKLYKWTSDGTDYTTWTKEVAISQEKREWINWVNKLESEERGRIEMQVQYYEDLLSQGDSGWEKGVNGKFRYNWIMKIKDLQQ